MLPARFALAVLADLGLVVEGPTSCLDEHAIRAELEGMLGPAHRTSTERAYVVASDDGLRVLLRAQNGDLLGERVLPAEGSCDEQARAAAVVLATWLGDAHPEYRIAAPSAPAQEPPTARDAPGASTPSVTPPHAESRKHEARGDASTRSPGTVAPSSNQGLHLTGAAALGVELSGARLSPALTLSGSLRPRGWFAGATAFVALVAPVERPLAAGRVASFRWPLGVGACVALAPGPLALELAVGPTLGLLHVEGRGFARNDSATDATVGVFSSVRLRLPRAPITPFVELTALGWPGRTRLEASRPAASSTLPGVEGLGVLGLALQR